MRKLILPAAALAFAPIPLAAQEAPAAASEAAPLADMAEQMRDPERQRELAMLAQTMTEILLDMPIAPLAQAAAEMAGEQARQVDPDLTLRKMVPEAGRVSEAIGRNAPQAMQAAGTMASAMAAMAPALREMAEQMARALPERK
ncbi:hypothetical protein [Erythrobacter mangrovi]|uniref:DUF2059 domain-containing protein n=1 Tax=Erythrobacter mangrovi TaxID=2739433 RepID=A0A7D4C2W2_9SPHN|nr:hypothetical protein [Erythrobacter mangrovi]QKG70585.1 hypothetical protein HQR01_03935 [Erythrobacter mangrovi]